MKSTSPYCFLNLKFASNLFIIVAVQLINEVPNIAYLDISYARWPLIWLFTLLLQTDAFEVITFVARVAFGIACWALSKCVCPASILALLILAVELVITIIILIIKAVEVIVALTVVIMKILRRWGWPRILWPILRSVLRHVENFRLTLGFEARYLDLHYVIRPSHGNELDQR